MNFTFLLFFFTMNTFALDITGKAFINKELVYTEKHKAILDSKGFYRSLSTDYYDKNNVLFASISSTFDKNLKIPDTVFQDKRFSLKETVVWDSVTQRITVIRSEAGKTKETALDVMPNAILSQGFHNYILENFEELKLNPHKDKQEIYFIVTKKNDQYRFVVYREKIENGQLFLIIQPANFFLKQLLSPIKLVYEISSKKILTFQGITNIDNPKGDSQSAVIEYSYQ